MFTGPGGGGGGYEACSAGCQSPTSRPRITNLDSALVIDGLQRRTWLESCILMILQEYVRYQNHHEMTGSMKHVCHENTPVRVSDAEKEWTLD